MKSLFYKPIKVNQDAKSILFWGCLHRNHACASWAKPLWAMRGFSSLEEHDDALVKNWNAKATDETVGFLLGDNVFGKDAQDHFKLLLNQLKFRHLYIMPGNHYSGWRQAFDDAGPESNNVLQIGSKSVFFVPNYLEAFINGQSVVMSHYPILSWNGQGGGSWMLFSHVHGRLEDSAVGRAYVNSGARCLEMSVEKWASPPAFAELKEIFSKREKVSFDHHGTGTANPF